MEHSSGKSITETRPRKHREARTMKKVLMLSACAVILALMTAEAFGRG